jgi:hypothetical protein
MIVANKFQTGFDQNKLCAMYVDKRLDGVAAVQTLSRLNRYVPGKSTMVLDFANKADDILAAFRPYYEEATIAATTDPNLIHDLQNKLDVSGIYTDEEVDAVAAVMVKGLGNNALTSAIGPAKERFRGALRAAVDGHNHARIAELEVFRKDVGTYVRLYDFLSQIVDFGDTDVEKHAIFYRVLATQIRSTRTAPDIDLSDVSLVHIRRPRPTARRQSRIALGNSAHRAFEAGEIRCCANGTPRLLAYSGPASWTHDVEGDHTSDFADDSALHECDESRGTRYSERHSAQNDVACATTTGGARVRHAAQRVAVARF